MTTRPLELAALPGLTDATVGALTGAGLTSIEALAAADPEALAATLGHDPVEVAALIEAARHTIAAADRHVIPLQVSPPGPDQLARGLRAARAIEHTSGLVRKARSHLGRHAPRKLGRPHRRARKQLKKLRRALEAVQHDVLARGLSEDALATLEARLEALDRELEQRIAGPIDKARLKETRRAAKRARASFGG